MALTKQDLNQIRTVVRGEIDTRVRKVVQEEIDTRVRKVVQEEIDTRVPKIVESEVDKLAIITAKGFAQVDKRFDRAEKRFADFQLHTDARLDIIEADLAEIKEANEMQDIPGRLLVVEKALNVKQ